MRRQTFQLKEQNKNPRRETKLETSNLSDRVQDNAQKDAQWTWEKEEHSEKLNKELGNIKKNQTKLKNTKAEIKTTLEIRWQWEKNQPTGWQSSGNHTSWTKKGKKNLIK